MGCLKLSSYEPLGKEVFSPLKVSWRNSDLEPDAPHAAPAPVIPKGYRYGFNGKEKDNETYGEADEYDYGARMYDPRVGRFLSVDPLTGKYPELTPYQFASNRPIDGLDLDGKEHWSYLAKKEEQSGNAYLKFTNWLTNNFVVNAYNMVATANNNLSDLITGRDRHDRSGVAFMSRFDDITHAIHQETLDEARADMVTLFSNLKDPNFVGDVIFNATLGVVTVGAGNPTLYWEEDLGVGISGTAGHPSVVESIPAAADAAPPMIDPVTLKPYKISALEPGQYAEESIPARGPGRDFTKAERDAINKIGNKYGCHTCGATSPGTKSGNWILDHQPANALINDGDYQEFYPHCDHCSKSQGGQIRGLRLSKPSSTPTQDAKK